jgi:membrane protease YdiL (CAAX protease family)
MAYDATAHDPIAPRWHTLALFALFALTTWYTTTHAPHAATVQHVSRIGRYAVSMAMEWLLLGLVMAGIYRRKDFLRTAFRSGTTSLIKAMGAGFITYLFGFFAILIVGGALYFTPLHHQRNEAVILAIAPRTRAELLAWFGVSLTAGVTEELIFRGYLQQQLTAWTQRPVVAIVLSALLFGAVHLYEGLGATLPLAALALVYGFVVRWFKGDLRAVILAHTLQDFIVALLVLARQHAIELHRAT